MSQNAARTFEDKPAVRESVPLLLGITGPSGGGKTYSALRLATGIQRVAGGDIYMIDTEARRGLHYADRFKFRHVAFTAPFGPLDYLAAINHCVKKGAGIVIVDSMSHEHEGPGGVLEMHETEMERLMKLRKVSSRDIVQFPAWAKPKADRRRLINSILQLPCHFIFCFRAKSKVKVLKKSERKQGEDAIQSLGYMPIAGEEFVFEMAANTLLMPNANGVPTWQSDEDGEKTMIKLPAQFRELFAKPGPLSEDHGTEMAKWAAGDGALKPPTEDELTEVLAQVAAAKTLQDVEKIAGDNRGKRWEKAHRAKLAIAIETRKGEIEAAEKEGAASEDGSSGAVCGCPDGPEDRHEPGCFKAPAEGAQGRML